jgi:hypothetical protein
LCDDYKRQVTRPNRLAKLAVDIAKSLLPPEVVIRDGVELVAAEALPEVELTLAALRVVVALEYTTGAMAGAL